MGFSFQKTITVTITITVIMNIEQELLEYFQTFHRTTTPNFKRIARDIRFKNRTFSYQDVRNGLLELMRNKYIGLNEGRYFLADSIETTYRERYLSKSPIVIFIEDGLLNQMKILAQQEGITLSRLGESFFAKCMNEQK